MAYNFGLWGVILANIYFSVTLIARKQCYHNVRKQGIKNRAKHFGTFFRKWTRSNAPRLEQIAPEYVSPDLTYLTSIYCTFDTFSGEEPVYVSKALQKAKIVVNEDGTKAAAATSEYLHIHLKGFKGRAKHKAVCLAQETVLCNGW